MEDPKLEIHVTAEAMEVEQTINKPPEPIPEPQSEKQMEVEPPKEPLEMPQEVQEVQEIQETKEPESVEQVVDMEEQEVVKGQELEAGDMEPLKTRNTTSVDERIEDYKEKEESSQQNDPISNEEAIRELAELFNSGDEDVKEAEAPVEEAAENKGDKEDKEDKEEEEEKGSEKVKKSKEPKTQKKEFGSQPGSSKKDDEGSGGESEAKKPKKRGRKKSALPENRLASDIEEKVSNVNPIMEFNPENNRFKIPNSELTEEQLKERYDDIIYHFRDEGEISCLVCLDDEAFVDDDIIICDLCSSAFHQTCYGSDLLNLPEDNEAQWYCQRCSYLFKNNLAPETVKCSFCPELKGAIKKIRENSNDKWAHIVCVNWIPEIYYQDEQERENVTITEYIAKNHCGRKNLLCCLCKIKYGDSIQCDSDKCVKSFHVTCAQRHGLICNWREMRGLKRDTDAEFYLPIYCKHHIQTQLSEEIFAFSNKVEERNKEKGHEVSHLFDPSVAIKVHHTPKRARKSKKQSEEAENSDIKPFSPGNYAGTKKRNRLKKNKKSLEKFEEEMKTPKRSRSKSNRNSSRRKETLYGENENTPKRSESKEKGEKRSDYHEESTLKEKGNEKKGSSKDNIDSTFISALPVETAAEKDTKKKKAKTAKLTEEMVIEDKEEVKIQVSLRGLLFSKPLLKKKERKLQKLDKMEKLDKAEKTEKAEKPDKNEKAERVDKIEKLNKIDKIDKEDKEENKKVLYKFRPNMAKLLRFNGWGTEKEMKKAISDYIKTKMLFRKDKDEMDVSKDPELEDIIGIARIPRKQIFPEFMHFMLKKNLEDVVREDDDIPFFSIYEEEINKMKEKKSPERISSKMDQEENQGERKIKKKAAFTKSNIAEKENPSSRTFQGKGGMAGAGLANKAMNQANGKDSLGAGSKVNIIRDDDSGDDFFTWKPRQTSTVDENRNSTNTSTHKGVLKPQESLNELKEPPISKKVKVNPPIQKSDTTNILQSLLGNKEDSQASAAPSKGKNNYEGLGPIINKADRIPFRKPMGWFVRTETSLIVPSINSQVALERFWPKGAEILF